MPFDDSYIKTRIAMLSTYQLVNCFPTSYQLVKRSNTASLKSILCVETTPMLSV